MLVLTMKKDERLFIGDRIAVMVVESSGPIRLGVEAPADVPIDRESVRLSKRADPKMLNHEGTKDTKTHQAIAEPLAAPASAAELWESLGESSFNN